ncbi:SDR family NAD(P)-dependent oxidoreductase [Pedococcus sp. P5_B7]
MTALTKGKVAVITGGASGIGLAMAEGFAARGLKVVIADFDAERLQSAGESLGEAGADVLAVTCDVTSASSVADLAVATITKFGTFDIVCNNAGTAGDFSTAWEIELAEYERQIAVNLWGVIYGIKAFVPHLIEKKSGHVLNTASMAGLTVNPRVAEYAMTKNAVVGLTEGLRADLDLVEAGVRAAALCPGAVRTPLAAAQASKFHAMTDRGGVAPPARDPLSDEVTLSSEQVAAAALRGIESDALYITPGIGAVERIASRFDRLLAEAAVYSVAPRTNNCRADPTP